MIAWYLDEIGNEIETEDELIEQKQVIEKVVDKLIYQDQVFLMALSFDWSVFLDFFILSILDVCQSKIPQNENCIQVIVPLANTAKGSLEEDPFLVVHPNYCYSDV